MNLQEIFSYLGAWNEKFNFPGGLLLMIAYMENGQSWNFKPNAISWRGAKGLMQITDMTVQQIKKLTGTDINAFNPSHSIWGAGVLLTWLYSQFGDWRAAIAAYNYGYGNVRKNIAKYGRLNEAALPKETRNYLAVVADTLGIEG